MYSWPTGPVLVNHAVVLLRAALANLVIVHPTCRFALLALAADSEKPPISENARRGGAGFGFGGGRRKVVSFDPGGDGCVRAVPMDLANEDADEINCPLDANELA